MQILFIILFMLIGVTVVSAPSTNLNVNTPELHVTQTVKEERKEALRHSEEIAILADCESKSNPDKGCIVDANGELSCGLLQFQKETFWRNNLKYKVLPELEYGEVENVWQDPEVQKELADHMLSEPQGWRNWTNCALTNNIDN